MADAPRYRVHAKSYLDNRLVNPGEEIEFWGVPGSALEPMNDAAWTKRDEANNERAKRGERPVNYLYKDKHTDEHPTVNVIKSDQDLEAQAEAKLVQEDAEKRAVKKDAIVADLKKSQDTAPGWRKPKVSETLPSTATGTSSYGPEPTTNYNPDYPNYPNKTVKSGQ